MKAAIVYYSFEGNTELIANFIAKYTKVKIIKLQPQKEIPKSGFRKFFWGGKSVIFNEKPKLLKESFDLEDYDTIFIGTPIWAGSYAPPIATFLANTKLENKKIVVFTCCSSGESAKCVKKFKDKLADNEIIDTIDFKDPLKADRKEVEKKVVELLKNNSMN